MSKSEINKLSKIPLNELDFVCKVCKEKLAALPFHGEESLPEGNQSFQFQEEHLENISLDDNSEVFKKKGLHFVHLNCNSLLSKTEKIREFVLQTKPHVICFSETKLDSTVNDEEVAIEGYNLILHDINRDVGGVACFVSNSIHYNQCTDFSKDFEKVFIDILSPKTKPILFGWYIDHHRLHILLNFFQIIF